jgi:hypothetical protein
VDKYVIRDYVKLALTVTPLTSVKSSSTHILGCILFHGIARLLTEHEGAYDWEDTGNLAQEQLVSSSPSSSRKSFLNSK